MPPAQGLPRCARSVQRVSLGRAVQVLEGLQGASETLKDEAGNAVLVRCGGTRLSKAGKKLRYAPHVALARLSSHVCEDILPLQAFRFPLEIIGNVLLEILKCDDHSPNPARASASDHHVRAAEALPCVQEPARFLCGFCK